MVTCSDVHLSGVIYISSSVRSQRRAVQSFDGSGTERRNFNLTLADGFEIRYSSENVLGKIHTAALRVCFVCVEAYQCECKTAVMVPVQNVS